MRIRFLKATLWLLTSLLILLAILVTALRVVLPHMDRFQDDITTWVNQQTQVNISIDNVKGYWRNTHPSISLNGLKAHNPDGSKLSLEAQSVDIEFDLLRSVARGQLVVADLTIHKLALDARSIKLSSDGESSTQPSERDSSLLATLDHLFLRQLNYFSIIDSEIQYQSVTGEIHSLAVEKLKWKNDGDQHRAEGQVSIVGTGVNSLQVSADFTDFGSFNDLSGQFYIKADKIALGPWLSTYLRKDMGIDDGEISFDAWINLAHSAPKSTYLSFFPSKMSWGGKHQLSLKSGVIELLAHEQQGERHWLVNTRSLSLATDRKIWPELSLKGDWSKKGWRGNINRIDIAALLPFIEVVPHSDGLKSWLSGLNPKGLLSDVRVAYDKKNQLRYSAQLKGLTTTQWKLLPEVHHLDASVSGNENRAIIHAELNDDHLPYGDVFQAPLNIEKGKATLVWQRDLSSWSLWSDHVAVKTPHLSALGEFRLIFPQDASPHLAIYAEANLNDAGQSWRYLPTRALGQNLTDYLSSSLQGGTVRHAQILWYGALGDFPYQDQTGVFQAYVPLKKGKFSFNTHWPSIDELQLDLLFQDESLHFESSSAQLMDVKAKHIVGDIPRLASSGYLDIDAKAMADGLAIRDYMMSTPLIDSVGAALTKVQVNGNVDADFKLHIPFKLDEQEVRAWGTAKLHNNNIDIESPPMKLTKVSGTIDFDNDKISAKSLSGLLLNQRVLLNFSGKSKEKGYQVHIATKGTWDVSKLRNYVGHYWTAPLKGDSPWSMGIDIQLNDIGFTYQVDLKGDLTRITSSYPYPLDKHYGDLGEFSVQASGNQETISARAQVPNAKYQAEIDITKPVPILTATNLIIGNGSFKPSPISGHQLSIRTDTFNIDKWAPIVFSDQTTRGRVNNAKFPIIPIPQHITIDVPELIAATLEWHDASIAARQQNVGWRIDIQSQEMQGEASYIEPYDLSVSLKQLHLYIPEFDQMDKSAAIQEVKTPEDAKITDFDRRFHELMPNLTLYIDDFWLQGYKVGNVNMDFQRQGDTLAWKNIDITSGTNEIHANGKWLLKGEQSHTSLNMEMKGDNNSDLMERFGVTSGIQKAPFSISSNIEWQGAPWSMQTNTINGTLKTQLGKGVVSDVSGAARLLGLFSLDSILRKMQLDFSDVFDKGMAFNSIKGSGKLSKGIFITNNITMDAVAGNMKIKGIVDLNRRLIDSEVAFVPDITSGIPVLSAFAVTPVTALYVLAITTVISPVVEVFTEVNYSVKGPIDSPTVKEISRTKGEFILPENLLKQVERQGATK